MYPRNDKAKLHRLEAGDGAGLLAFIAGLRHRLDPSDDASTLVVSCFEAGRDGFWLHRLLIAHGVINHVVEPTSILVTRGARRAKTDRLDAVGLLRVLAAKFAGDPGACRTVVVPSVEEEDAKRPHREREFLVQERVRIENRIGSRPSMWCNFQGVAEGVICQAALGVTCKGMRSAILSAGSAKASICM